MYQSRTVSHADGTADRLGNAALADLDRALAMMGIAQWAYQDGGSRWQADLGIRTDRVRISRWRLCLGTGFVLLALMA